MEITGNKIALVQYKYGGMQTSSYSSPEELLIYLLNSNGAEFLSIAEQKLEEARKAWAEDADEQAALETEYDAMIEEREREDYEITASFEEEQAYLYDHPELA